MDSETEICTEPPPQQYQVQDLMQMLGLLLDQKLASIQESMPEILQQVTNQTQRITNAQQRISTLEDELDKTQKILDTQQREITILADKVDLENRIKGANTQSNFLIERFHRIGLPPTADSNRPRQVVLKLLNYTDKMNILSSYRKKNNL
ncbi:hypothetical protein XELAEV_18026984mg [Xenopus laevis]|uniref:Uncharacterized protein n=1 Tax=Xenopus laevis TaxID=8355 RepID=A0A974CUQ9_XENLA|nr:hypothetical protein XELAEV_18026984mg [Xenopus laevis]